MTQPSNLGGRRPGAGRPPKPPGEKRRRQVGTQLTDHDWQRVLKELTPEQRGAALVAALPKDTDR